MRPDGTPSWFVDRPRDFGDEDEIVLRDPDGRVSVIARLAPERRPACATEPTR